MNGVDWQAVRASYAKLLPLVGSRSDLNYLIGEIIGRARQLAHLCGRW